MATDLINVDFGEADEHSLQYDPNMPMGHLRKLFKSGNEGDLEGMMGHFSKIVKAWSFDGDPSELDAWDEVGRLDFMALNEAIMDSLGKAGEA